MVCRCGGRGSRFPGPVKTSHTPPKPATDFPHEQTLPSHPFSRRRPPWHLGDAVTRLNHHLDGSAKCFRRIKRAHRWLPRRFRSHNQPGCSGQCHGQWGRLRRLFAVGKFSHRHDRQRHDCSRHTQFDHLGPTRHQLHSALCQSFVRLPNVSQPGNGHEWSGDHAEHCRSYPGKSLFIPMVEQHGLHHHEQRTASGGHLRQWRTARGCQPDEFRRRTRAVPGRHLYRGQPHAKLRLCACWILHGGGI